MCKKLDLYSTAATNYIYFQYYFNIQLKFTVKVLLSSSLLISIYVYLPQLAIFFLIHVIEGIIDRFLYLDILETQMVPYVDDNFPLSWIFQHDTSVKT